MNNLSSYCWLVDAKIRASDKDLPVNKMKNLTKKTRIYQRKKNNFIFYLVLVPAAAEPSSADSAVGLVGVKRYKKFSLGRFNSFSFR